MQAGLVLWKPEEHSDSAYFPMDGYISLEAISKAQPALEVGMVGHEGMAGLHLLLGAPSSSLLANVQIAGNVYVCSAKELRALMHDCIAFRDIMQRYIGFKLSELSATAVCVRFHRIEQRLAKWLLMAQDRVGPGRLQATHETMARLLGVRRVGITVAATDMQIAGYIRYNRGEIELLNRKGLERSACSCYAQGCSEYAHFAKA